MGIAGQILQHMLGTPKGRPGIDHPLLIPQPMQQGVESACAWTPKEVFMTALRQRMQEELRLSR
jgi:hypothetical protein